MKRFRIIYFLLPLMGLLVLSSCEDVVDIDTPTGDRRLIIDALIRIDTSEAITEMRVVVSETNGFFESIPPANLQQITLSNLDNPLPDAVVFIEEEPGTGVYVKSLETALLLEDRWLLQIDFEDEFYLAETTFVAAPQIDELEQGDGFVFDDDDTEIEITFTDIPGEDNYYVFDFGFGEYLATEDTFYQDQQFVFSYFYDDPFEVGTEVPISILGADADFYNYMNQIIEQSEDEVNPFQTPTLTVRGNFINVTDIDNDGTFDNTDNEDNFALGYFAFVQQNTSTIVIEDL
ncbi:DUF4249 family protein [Gilvibacter sediminis]|uniref:DUF4249 family protein n=1 Tax=Gilvibacter sediminis TaxID=379071 RepID=UPI0023509C03|nr:DUF4249 family protein [Gilvibacter sediminis]MDC7997814.1 DUF4249 family protein [Gilvibacter sediminis]